MKKPGSLLVHCSPLAGSLPPLIGVIAYVFFGLFRGCQSGYTMGHALCERRIFLDGIVIELARG
jgi:hypothetical protein